MARNLISRLCHDPHWHDPRNWPPVADEFINPDVFTLYQQRKTAVVKYCLCEWTLKFIEEKYGFKRKDFLRLIKRCLQKTSDGGIVGFAGLIPYNRLSSTRGKLRKLFDQFPELEEYVQKKFQGKRIKGEQEDPEYKMSVADVHEAFLKRCRQLGIQKKQFPFNSKSEGRESLRRYLKNLYHDNTSNTIAFREGQEARQNLSSTDIDDNMQHYATRPYEIVQADAHRIHGYITILVEDINGIVSPIPLERPWVIFLIDVFSRAILGYYFSLNSEPSSNDLLECVAHTLVPWKPKELSIEGWEYPDSGGLPSGVFERCAWRAFDRLEIDNAMAHISPWVQERINHVTQCTIRLGKSKHPTGRAIVERFIKTIEGRSFHRLPSTTGSHPKDNRRRKPEEKAKNFQLTLHQVEELLDVIIARYNTTSSTSISNHTPLHYLELGDSQKTFWVRTVQEAHRRSLPLFYQYYTATIRGGKYGRRPYIQFKHAIYRSEALVASSAISGMRVTLEVYTKDLSSMRVFLPDGSTLGFVKAQGRWANKPHSLKTREAICQLMAQNVISPNSPDPISAYYRHTYQQSRQSRKAASAMTKSLKEANKMIVVCSDLDDAQVVTSSKEKQQKVHAASWEPRKKNWITLSKTKRK